MKAPQHRSRIQFACLAFLTLIGALGAEAGSLRVVESSARVGTFGLEVEVGSSCAGPIDLTIVQDSLSGPATYEACKSILASSTEVINSGPVILRSGERIVLGEGFIVRTGASFTAVIDAGLDLDAFVEDRSPHHESSYSAAFFLRPDGLLTGDSSRLDLFTALNEDGTPTFWVTLERDATLGTNQIVVQVRQDDGTVATTEGVAEAMVPNGWSWLGLNWIAASEEESNGSFELLLNGLLASALTGISNASARIETVRLGATNVDLVTTGTLDFDQFQSLSTREVLPPP